MRQPVLLAWYNDLPQRHRGERTRAWNQRFRKALSDYRNLVQSRYLESALEKLLGWADADVRQAATLALGMTGNMKINAGLAERLHDDDAVVRQLAADALWSIWFRADTPDNNHELQRLISLKLTAETRENILSGYQALLLKAPNFAEAYNQRAIIYYRLGEYARAAADCDKALRLNPYHFGAASGMAQCFMKQKKVRAALRSYRRASRINPNLDGVQQIIASLEKQLGEEGKREI